MPSVGGKMRAAIERNKRNSMPGQRLNKHNLHQTEGPGRIHAPPDGRVAASPGAFLDAGA